MRSTEINLIGFHKLQVKLKRNMNLSAVKSAVKKSGSEMQKKAQKEAPIDSGHLHDVIFLEITDGGMTAEVIDSRICGIPGIWNKIHDRETTYTSGIQ